MLVPPNERVLCESWHLIAAMILVTSNALEAKCDRVHWSTWYHP